MKKLKKPFLLIFLIFIVVTLPLSITFSKYVIKKIGNYILEANHFYFNSDKLKEGGASYQMNNWSGVSSFNIQFELNNRKNNILTSSSDISYNLSITCDNDVTCTLDSPTSGIIYAKNNSKSFNLTINPTKSFKEGESITINVSATSTSPYIKTLSAKYVITVGKQGITYAITDAANATTLNFIITNALDYYNVDEAFLTYAIGDKISYETYKTLSSDNQSKCTSYKVTLAFDPNVVIVDPTSEIVKTSTQTYETINNVQYVNSLTFKVDALSSNSIRFYKIVTANNYTYPLNYNSSVISFNAVE
jgi:hypothetical protein